MYYFCIMNRINEVLKEKGITQIQLSERLGITNVGMNKIIRGNPNLKTLHKIARALDVDIRKLLIPTKKETEIIYAKRGGEFVPVGRIEK